MKAMLLPQLLIRGEAYITQTKTIRVVPGTFVGNADERHVPVFGVPSSKDDMSSTGHLHVHMEKDPLGMSQPR